jgi:hypothetical protein
MSSAMPWRSAASWCSRGVFVLYACAGLAAFLIYRRLPNAAVAQAPTIRKPLSRSRSTVLTPPCSAWIPLTEPLNRYMRARPEECGRMLRGRTGPVRITPGQVKSSSSRNGCWRLATERAVRAILGENLVRVCHLVWL